MAYTYFRGRVLNLKNLPIFEGNEMAKDEKTSKGVASKASEQLKDKKSTPDQKSVAGSALTQAPDKKKK
jgi:hypothetical protein